MIIINYNIYNNDYYNHYNNHYHNHYHNDYDNHYHYIIISLYYQYFPLTIIIMIMIIINYNLYNNDYYKL